MCHIHTYPIYMIALALITLYLKSPISSAISLSLSLQLLYVLQVYREKEQEKEKQQQTSTATLAAPSVTPIKMGRGSTQLQPSCCWLLMLLIVAQTVYGKCGQGEQSAQLVDSYRHTHTHAHTPRQLR